METYFKKKLEFARRKRCLMIINEQFGANEADNVFLDMLAVDPDDEVQRPKAGFYSGFYRFRDVEEIKARLADGSVLCGFYDRETAGRINVAFGKGRKAIDFVKLRFCANSNLVEKRCGLTYCKIELHTEDEANLRKNDTPSLTKQAFLDLFGDGYCILLPLLDRSDDSRKDAGPKFAGHYTVVTHKWEVLNDDENVGHFSKPGLCDRLYESLQRR